MALIDRGTSAFEATAVYFTMEGPLARGNRTTREAVEDSTRIDRVAQIRGYCRWRHGGVREDEAA